MKNNHKAPADLATIFRRLPAQSYDEAGEIGETLVAGADAAKPKEAMHGLAIYAPQCCCFPDRPRRK